MRKTLFAAALLGCFALHANAKPGNPKKGNIESILTEYVIELMHAGYLTPSDCADVLDEAMGYDYGIMTLAIAKPNKGNGKGPVFTIPEEEVPLSILPGIEDSPVIDETPVYSPEGYEDGGIPEFVIALPNGKLKMNNKYGDKIKIKKVK